MLLKFWRVTIRGAQPSARLSEEICLSEGSAGVSQRAPGVSPRVLRGLCGVVRGPRDFPRFFGGSDPIACDPREVLDIQLSEFWGILGAILGMALTT